MNLQTMLDKFQHYISEHSLIKKDQKILLAVSGGIDSMVMMYLFKQLENYPFAVVHCNFQLRGEESDKDQEFVRSTTKQYNINFFTRNFDTRKYASDKGISIQMAARELRYNWFMKLAKEHQFDRIAVAHNKDDIAETMIINLVRGTGVKGLTGIKALSGITIRPLLFITRTEIKSLAKKHGINFREDSSNAEVKYKRNLIRHQIFPLLEQLNPSVKETLSLETEVFSATWDIYHSKIEALKKETITSRGNQSLVNIAKLLELKITPPLLYDILSEFEFSYRDISRIYNSLRAESGKKFFSSQYALLKDRESLIIEKIDVSPVQEKYNIDEGIAELTIPLNLSIKKVPWSHNYANPKISSVASLDCDTLNYPLTLRHWQDGDYFYPLGMKGKKKLSDFFTDLKIDLFKKKRIWLLTSANEIVWIVGYRIDDRFKITPQTKNILLLEIKD